MCGLGGGGGGNLTGGGVNGLNNTRRPAQAFSFLSQPLTHPPITLLLNPVGIDLISPPPRSICTHCITSPPCSGRVEVYFDYALDGGWGIDPFEDQRHGGGD